MSYLRFPLLASTLALAATGALADITADAAWDDFSEWLSVQGEMEVGDETRDGDTLTVSDIVVTNDNPNGSGTVTIPSLTFTENGDGTVLLTLPSEMSVNSTSSVEGEAVDVSMSFAQEGMEIVLSGTDGMVERYDFEGDSLTMTFDEPSASDPEAELALDLSVVFNGIDGVYDIAGDTLRQIESQTTFESITIDMSGVVPEGTDNPGNFALTASFADLDGSGSSTIPMDSSAMEEGDLPAMIAAGFGFDANTAFQSISYDFSGNGPDGRFEVKGSTEAGGFEVSMGEDGLIYGTEARNTSVEVFSAEMPIPGLIFTLAESAQQIRFPLAPSETPQEFGMMLRLVDLVVPDALWGMADPAGMLPRDPATLEIDVTGTGIVTENFMAPDYDGGQPGELQSVTVDTLRLAMVGAELTGDGEFTFTTGPDGMPVPAGVANLMLTGGNRLLDALVSMGMIPEEQAMGARMMVSMFAEQGEGEDTLVSEIEVKEDGQILANGQRIR